MVVSSDPGFRVTAADVICDSSGCFWRREDGLNVTVDSLFDTNCVLWGSREINDFIAQLSSRVADASSPNDPKTVPPRIIAESSRYTSRTEVSVGLHTGALRAPARLVATLQLQTNNPVFPSLSVPIVGNVVPELEMCPTMLLLSYNQVNGKYEGVFNITSHNSTIIDIELLNPSFGLSWMTVEQEESVVRCTVFLETVNSLTHANRTVPAKLKLGDDPREEIRLDIPVRIMPTIGGISESQ